jgi:2-(1,2-epoxy-1,2-dihydrophenyl)acetyl-CoA isomerase
MGAAVSPPYVTSRRLGPVALITMDHPETLNAMDQDLGPELARALEETGRDPGVGAVVLAGAGGVFSAGGNLARAARHLENRPGASELFAAYTVWVARVVAALARHPRPVVCAVGGAASGAGLAWMLASDLVVCAADAKLVGGFVAAGLAPGAGVSLTLPRLAGLPRAAELLWLNRPLPPETALAWGLVDELAPRERVLDRALELAAELAAGPREALAATKRLLNQAGREGLLPQGQAERRAVLALADTEEFRKRVARFAGGRPGKARE